MHPFLKVLILSQEFHESKKKKIELSSKTLPGSSLRARSLNASPKPNPPLNPGSKRPCSQARHPPSPRFPSRFHPSSLYLSNYLPTPLATNLRLYLPPYRLPPSPCPPYGPPPSRCTNSRFPYPSQGLFSFLSSPQAHPDSSRAVFLFFLFLC